jgi:hypothetical protein
LCAGYWETRELIIKLQNGQKPTKHQNSDNRALQSVFEGSTDLAFEISFPVAIAGNPQ